LNPGTVCAERTADAATEIATPAEILDPAIFIGIITRKPEAAILADRNILKVLLFPLRGHANDMVQNGHILLLVMPDKPHSA